MIIDVHHVGIAVSSLQKALAFFSGALSLSVVKEGEAPARGARVAVLSAGRGYLEIIEPVADSSPFARFIAERGEGLHHLALWSDSVDEQVAALREKAVELEDHEPREGFTGRLSYLHPHALGGAILEVVEPEEALTPRTGRPAAASQVRGRGEDKQAWGVTRIDHVVLRVPDSSEVSRKMEDWFGIETKRTFERGGHTFAFLRPGDAIIEVIGPTPGGEPGSGRIAGLAFEVNGINELTASLKKAGYPVGEPHPALQGGRIVSVHHSGASGVPVAFIDFSGSPGPRAR